MKFSSIKFSKVNKSLTRFETVEKKARKKLIYIKQNCVNKNIGNMLFKFNFISYFAIFFKFWLFLNILLAK